jgi:hypothetical protein
VRFPGKLYRGKFDTADLALAKRKLRTFKDDLERTDATKGNSSFAAVLEAQDYVVHRIAELIQIADAIQEDADVRNLRAATVRAAAPDIFDF